MTTKTIITVYGNVNEGKTETIKRVCQILCSDFPDAKISNANIDYSKDILLTIQFGNVKIGIESQASPDGRIINENSIKKLADKKIDSCLGDCDIIVCATRLEEKTANKVDEIATDYGYNKLWMSNNFNPNLTREALNSIAAENIVDVIKKLINGEKPNIYLSE